MEKNIDLGDAVVIPNGVDINRFRPIDKKLCQDKLGWDKNTVHLLFASNPARYEKNYTIAQQAFELLKDLRFEIHYLKNIKKLLI
jgi:glycosyltransferase involved in cell wall biosynthesis